MLGGWQFRAACTHGLCDHAYSACHACPRLQRACAGEQPGSHLLHKAHQGHLPCWGLVIWVCMMCSCMHVPAPQLHLRYACICGQMLAGACAWLARCGPTLHWRGGVCCMCMKCRACVTNHEQSTCDACLHPACQPSRTRVCCWWRTTLLRAE